MTDKQWQTMLDVHVTAPFRLIQASAPGMRATSLEFQMRRVRAAVQQM